MMMVSVIECYCNSKYSIEQYKDYLEQATQMNIVMKL